MRSLGERRSSLRAVCHATWARGCATCKATRARCEGVTRGGLLLRLLARRARGNRPLGVPRDKHNMTRRELRALGTEPAGGRGGRTLRARKSVETAEPVDRCHPPRARARPTRCRPLRRGGLVWRLSRANALARSDGSAGEDSGSPAPARKKATPKSNPKSKSPSSEAQANPAIAALLPPLSPLPPPL